jgi:hypothetical protein
MKTQIIPGKISFLTRFSLVLMLFAFLIVFQTNIVQAAEISPDLNISGSATFDEDFFYFYNTTLSGNIYKKVGGTDSPSSFTESTFPAPNPQAGTLTHTGDGAGTALEATTTNPYSYYWGEIGVGVNLLLNLSNTSLNQYLVRVRVEFENTVELPGPFTVDSDTTGFYDFADSEFFVEDSALTELTFTDIVSDTYYGNNQDSSAPYGGSFTESFDGTFDVLLGAGAEETILGMYTLTAEFGDFWNDSGSNRYSSVDFSGFLSIDYVENLGPGPNAVPIPAALPLFGSGLLALAAIRRRFRG